MSKKRNILTVFEKFTRVFLLISNIYSTISNGIVPIVDINNQKPLIITNAVVGGISILISYTNECLKNSIHNHDIESEKPSLKASRSINIKEKINTWIPFNYSM